MSNYRKLLNDQFEEHLTQEYRSYCNRQNLEETMSGLVTYIIDRELIPEMNIKRYTILREFDPIYKKNENHKTSAVEILADKFNLSKRTIWSILKRKNKKE